jgi:DNA-binding HxlR family transcriptional regulator
MVAIQSLPELSSRWGDENLCVTRLHGKWAFSILRQLQRGPTQFSQLGRALAQTSRKKLPQYLCKLEKAGLIIVDRSGRMPQDEYALSDPLGIAAAHLMNALAQSNRRGTGVRV